MNDLFIKIIEKLGSIDNTLLFAVSIIPYAIFLFYLYKIKSFNNFINPNKITKSLRVRKDSANPCRKSTSTRVLSK